MHKLLILITGILFTFSVEAQIILPSSEINTISIDKKKEYSLCNSRRLVDIGATPDRSGFNTYLSNIGAIKILESNIPYRIKLYKSMYSSIINELKSDPNINKYKGKTTKEIWNTPYGITDAYLPWISNLVSYKRKIETDMCRLKWQKEQIKKYPNIPKYFIKTYNSLYDSYQSIQDKCVKPNIKGWTQNKEAIDYAGCMNKNWRYDSNMKLRELKKYTSIRKGFMPILKSLGLSNRIKPSI